MDTPYVADLRAERLIASGRLTLSALTLLALWLDPHQPSRLPPLGYGVVTLYVLYAAALALAAWVPNTRLRRWRIVTHVVDLLAYTAIVYFTSGAISPFFAMFVFALFAAALRWGWPGVLGTAAAALAAYGVIGLATLPASGEVGAVTFAVRFIYLGVFAVLLGHLGSHHRRLRHEMTTLAAMPTVLATDPPSVARQVVERALDVLRADEAILVWAEHGQRGAAITRRHAGGVVEKRSHPVGVEAMVAPALQATSFLSTDGTSAEGTVLYLHEGDLRRWRGAALTEAGCAELPAGPLLALRLAGRTLEGRLFAAARHRFHADDLVLGELMARQFTPQLDGAHQSQHEQRQAALEERARLARDLHDGAIQSLTGASLRLHAVDRLLGERPAEARQLLEEIDDLLVSEQQELRWFASEPSGDWGLRIEQLSDRMARNWGMEVWLENDAIALLVGDFGHEVYRIVQEGLANAARHGGARNARVTLSTEGQSLHLQLIDDGRGFPFQGDLDDTALRERRLGPVSIKQRVSALDGRLAISSGATGARLDIEVPLVVTSPP